MVVDLMRCEDWLSLKPGNAVGTAGLFFLLVQTLAGWLSPDGTHESSGNQESEQSSATIVPMARRASQKQRRGVAVMEERRRRIQATPALASPAGQHHRPHRPASSWAGSDNRRQAAPAHGIPAEQCHRSQRPTGSRAGIVRQLKAISPPPPPERRLLGKL